MHMAAIDLSSTKPSPTPMPTPVAPCRLLYGPYTPPPPLHAQPAIGQVNFRPGQGEQLALAQDRQDRHHDEGAKPVPLGRGERSFRFLRGTWPHLVNLVVRDPGR